MWTCVCRYQNVSSLDFIGAKDDGGGGDNWRYDIQSSSQIITTNKPTPSSYYRPNAIPVAQPTVSEQQEGHPACKKLCVGFS